MMHGHEKSDHAIVAVKPANKAERPPAERSAAEPNAAEPGEPRAGDQGECGPAKHAPDTESGKRVTGAGTHTCPHRSFRGIVFFLKQSTPTLFPRSVLSRSSS
jgi:hypothetical protein